MRLALVEAPPIGYLLGNRGFAHRVEGARTVAVCQPIGERRHGPQKALRAGDRPWLPEQSGWVSTLKIEGAGDQRFREQRKHLPIAVVFQRCGVRDQVVYEQADGADRMPLP